MVIFLVEKVLIWFTNLTFAPPWSTWHSSERVHRPQGARLTERCYQGWRTRGHWWWFWTTPGMVTYAINRFYYLIYNRCLVYEVEENFWQRTRANMKQSPCLNPTDSIFGMSRIMASTKGVMTSQSSSYMPKTRFGSRDSSQTGFGSNGPSHIVLLWT